MEHEVAHSFQDPPRLIGEDAIADRRIDPRFSEAQTCSIIAPLHAALDTAPHTRRISTLMKCAFADALNETEITVRRWGAPKVPT